MAAVTERPRPKDIGGRPSSKQYLRAVQPDAGVDLGTLHSKPLFGDPVKRVAYIFDNQKNITSY